MTAPSDQAPFDLPPPRNSWKSFLLVVPAGILSISLAYCGYRFYLDHSHFGRQYSTIQHECLEKIYWAQKKFHESSERFGTIEDLTTETPKDFGRTFLNPDLWKFNESGVVVIGDLCFIIYVLPEDDFVAYSWPASGESYSNLTLSVDKSGEVSEKCRPGFRGTTHIPRRDAKESYSWIPYEPPDE